MKSEDELREKLRALEEENARLRSRGGGNEKRPDAVSAREEEYKGFPVISFEGPFRTFSFGVRKAAAVLRCIEDLRKFVEKHGGMAVLEQRVQASPKGDTEVDGGDGKI